jgi:hypothetical protein
MYADSRLWHACMVSHAAPHSLRVKIPHHPGTFKFPRLFLGRGVPSRDIEIQTPMYMQAASEEEILSSRRTLLPVMVQTVDMHAVAAKKMKSEKKKDAIQTVDMYAGCEEEEERKHDR